MKKFVFGLCFVFLSAVLFPQSQITVTIDEAISQSAGAISRWFDNIEINFDRKGVIIDGFSGYTPPSLKNYILPRLQAALLNNNVNLTDRDRMEASQKRLYDDYNTKRISDASVVPGSDLIAVRFIIDVKCEKNELGSFDYSLNIVDIRTQRRYISFFIVKNDSRISRMTRDYYKPKIDYRVQIILH